METVEYKICNKCKDKKSINEFSIKNRSYRYGDKVIKAGRSTICKVCSNAKRKAWGDKNKDKIRSHMLMTYYGITLDDFNNLLSSQDGKCLICRVDLKDGSMIGPKGACVDHCHRTNKIRGILCGKCNSGLGYFDDNTTSLRNAVDYLDRDVQYE